MSGAEQVFVHVNRDNKVAQELYYKIGFEVHILPRNLSKIE